MGGAKHNPKPDETDSSAAEPSPNRSDQTESGITKTNAGKGTASRQQAEAGRVPADAEKTEEEYILERESDGRYRIVGRRSSEER
jgi:hypothetical protein